jgi:hypothetical protein
MLANKSRKHRRDKYENILFFCKITQKKQQQNTYKHENNEIFNPLIKYCIFKVTGKNYSFIDSLL